MFDYQAIKLMHRHGDDDWFAMSETEHGPAAHDPERSWLRAGQIWRCLRCDEEVVVLPQGDDRPDGDPL